MYATYRRDTPRGTSTKTPSFEKPWYGCVMPYHIHAAAPPAINTITSNIASKYFNSASRIRFLTAGQFFLLDESSLEFFQQALGFPAGEPFVRHFHRHANLFSYPLREALRFFGHFTA